MTTQLLIQMTHLATRLHRDDPRGGIKPANALQTSGEHHHPALEGDALPIIPGASTPHREWDAMFGARCCQLFDGGHRLRARHQLRTGPRKLGSQHRRVVVCIAGTTQQLARFVLKIQVGNMG